MNVNGKERGMLASLVEAELKAGEAIPGVYGIAAQAEPGTDLSPVTETDRLSHEALTDHLRRHTPFPILSEEGRAVPYDERRRLRHNKADLRNPHFSVTARGYHG